MKPSHFYTYGNPEILKHPKTAFLCSRTCPVHIIQKAYDWATEQREKGNCIISGFHSQIEKDVFRFLLQGKQPLILALARGKKKRLEPDIRAALEAERLLMVTPFDENITRISARTARRRNELIAELADVIFIAHAAPGGNVERLAAGYRGKKPILTFEAPENRHLIREGIPAYRGESGSSP